MALVTGDRVKETSTTTGTGTYTLAGAVTNFQAFSAVCANGDTCYYAAVDQSGSGWEAGVGTWATGGTLARTTILASSNSGSAVNWSAGTRDIFITIPAKRTVNNLLDLYAGVPAASAFTWSNQNSATATDSSPAGRAIFLKAGGTDAANNNINVLYRAAPSTPYRVAALIQAGANLGNFGDAGQCGWFDGTKLHAFRYHGNGSAAVPHLSVTRFSNTTTFVSNDLQVSMAMHTPFLFGLYDDGTNVHFQISFDGVNFETYYSVAKASGYLGSSGYTNVFWSVNRRTGLSTPPFATLRLWDEGALSRAFP